MVNIDKKYVVGFYFDTQGGVILIEKQKPQWQKGFLNGVGGHIEQGETPIEAMAREFREETGILEPIEWKHYCTATQERSPGILHFFWAFGIPYEPQQTTIERVAVYKIDDLPKLKTHRNLKWLVPMACDVDVKSAMINFE